MGKELLGSVTTPHRAIKVAIMRAPKEISDTVIKTIHSRLPALLVAVILASFISGCAGRDNKPGNLRTGITAEELYIRAKDTMDRTNYERAAQLYRLLQARFPFGRHTEQAMLELAYCLYKGHRPDEALAQLDKFVKTYPSHRNTDYAYYLKGLINFSRTRGMLARLDPNRAVDRDQRFARESFNDFARLLRAYPESDYAGDARQRMLFLRDNMAANEIMVADYYMRRRAYVAAAARAKYVVESYQESSSVGDALAVLVDAYTELGLTDNAEDALNVLKLNYPEHGYLTGNYKRQSLFARLWPFD